MSQIQSYKDLEVWKRSMELVVEIYSLVSSFPREEIYGLTSQIKRSAVSIPSNIAEGHKRGSKKDYKRFLHIAFGSGAELETQIEIAKQLQFITIKSAKKTDQLLDEIMKMLHVLIKKLQ